MTTYIFELNLTQKELSLLQNLCSYLLGKYDSQESYNTHWADCYICHCVLRSKKDYFTIYTPDTNILDEIKHLCNARIKSKEEQVKAKQYGAYSILTAYNGKVINSLVNKINNEENRIRKAICEPLGTKHEGYDVPSFLQNKKGK